MTKPNAPKVPNIEDKSKGYRKSVSLNKPVKSTFPMSNTRKILKRRIHNNVESKIDVKVTPKGDTRFVTTSVAIICPANIKAQRIVNHSEMS